MAIASNEGRPKMCQRAEVATPARCARPPRNPIRGANNAPPRRGRGKRQAGPTTPQMKMGRAETRHLHKPALRAGYGLGFSADGSGVLGLSAGLAAGASAGISAGLAVGLTADGVAGFSAGFSGSLMETSSTSKMRVE